MDVPIPKRRIPFAYHLAGWSPKNGDRNFLKASANKIAPGEYDAQMDGSIFCPECFTNLNRIPKLKDIFSNQREPFFAHQQRWSQVKCDLRSNKPKGKRYDTWEEARKAVENKELVIVSGFIQDEPENLAPPPNTDYVETPVEDLEGPPAKAPLPRHVGKDLELPSSITSVLGICRNFDVHALKYYQLPNYSLPMRLIDLLKDLRTVTETNETPRLYYAIVRSSNTMGQGHAENIRMTWLECHPAIADFCIKTSNRIATRKGIGEGVASKGRIVLIYGKVTVSGIGLTFNQPAWGEYALLPSKYNQLLIS